MAPGDTITGVRLADEQRWYDDGAPEGQAFYGRDDTGSWHVWIHSPDGRLGGDHGAQGWGGNLTNHQVVEHEDGTITVSPSILITFPGTDWPEWHGYLERGVFREV